MSKCEGHDETDYRGKHDHTRPDLSAEGHEKNKIILQNLRIRICIWRPASGSADLDRLDSQLCRSGADAERTLKNC